MENIILAAIATLVASVSVLTDFFKRLFNINKKWVIELMSWVIAIGVTYVAWIFCKIPAIFQPEWMSILFEGLLVGIAANIAHGYEITKNILNFIFSFINKTKKAE